MLLAGLQVFVGTLAIETLETSLSGPQWPSDTPKAQWLLVRNGTV